MKHFATFFLLLIIQNGFAQSTQTGKPEAFIKRPLVFTENKGQITDQHGNARNDIQYKVATKGLSIFVGKGQLHYQWSKPLTRRKIPNKFSHSFLEKPDTSAIRYSMYRLDMELAGANPDAQVIAEDKQDYHENYHTAALHGNNATASTYKKITYKNIYPHIDWVLYIKDNTLEYDFIINPGGNVSDIKIKYGGATDIARTDKNIKVATPFGAITERNLYAYEQATRKPITASYGSHKNSFGFKLTTHDPRLTTIIDPVLAWGTYYGGDGEDESLGMACSGAGDAFICGLTTSLSNVATTGAYQTVYGGNEDAFLAKFNSEGMRMWATYYGGPSQDYATSVTCDSAGNVYITGLTYSSAGIATPGSQQAT
jgi:Beta-propeller repeat